LKEKKRRRRKRKKEEEGEEKEEEIEHGDIGNTGVLVEMSKLQLSQY
jgi:hypothetical protein